MKRMMLLSVAALLCLGVAATVYADAQEKTAPGVGVMTLEGQGEVSVAPDLAYISLGVVTEAKTASQAVSDNNKSMDALFKRLKEQGVTDKEIKTSNFSVQPRYHYKKDEEAVLVGYTASNTVRVTVCDLTKLGTLLDLLVKDGANRVNGIAFGVADSKKAMNEARVLATKDALGKAKLYAEAAGLNLGNMKSFTESAHQSRGMELYSAARAESAAADRVPVSGGSLTFRVSVQVTWEFTTVGHGGDTKKPKVLFK